MVCKVRSGSHLDVILASNWNMLRSDIDRYAASGSKSEESSGAAESRLHA